MWFRSKQVPYKYIFLDYDSYLTMTIDTRKFGNYSNLRPNPESEHRRSVILSSEQRLISQVPHKPSNYYDCCEFPDIIENRGVLTCKNCAIVHKPIMKDGFISNPQDHTFFTARKTNNPYLDYGCRTSFNHTNLSPKKRLLFQRLAKLNNYFNNSTEMNMQIANRFLFTVAGQLEIPKSIQSFAIHLYKKVIDARLTMGRSIKEMVVACLYIACNLKHYPRHISEFSNKSAISEKKIRKAYRLLLYTFKIRLNGFSLSHYIDKFSTELNLSPDFKSSLLKIADSLHSEKLNTTANPRGITVALIYLLSTKLTPGFKIKQKILAGISKVSEVTIRKYVKIIKTKIVF